MIDAALKVTEKSAINQPSKLFPQLFRNCKQGERVTVLDVGKATPGTVEFFSRFACRVQFMDLYDEPVMRALESKDKKLDLTKQFASLLDFPQGTKFDVCLFWDFMNFLSKPALHAFSTALRPWIRRNTRGHGFGIHNVGTKLRNQQFSIAGVGGFHVRDKEGEPLRFYPHSHAELFEYLGYLDIERGVLLPDGKVEILLRTVL